MSPDMTLPACDSLALVFEDGVLRLRLNQPDKRNCLTRAFWSELPAVVAWAERQPAVRCLMLEAEGPVFTAGIDLAVLQELDGLGAGLESSRRGDYLRRTVLSLQRSLSCLADTDLPVIAAIQGACIGGGLDLVCAADIRLASIQASFVPLEVDLGFVPDLGTVQRLSQQLPAALVNDWLMSCRSLSGEEALASGFVSRLSEEPDSLRRAARELAASIAARSPIALRGVKQSLRFTREHGLRASLQYTAAWQSGVFPGADLPEALAARAQGRAPRFDDLAADLSMPGADDAPATEINS